MSEYVTQTHIDKHIMYSHLQLIILEPTFSEREFVPKFSSYVLLSNVYWLDKIKGEDFFVILPNSRAKILPNLHLILLFS